MKRASKAPARRGSVELRKVRAGDFVLNAKHGGTLAVLADAAVAPWSRTVYVVRGVASDTGQDAQRVELGSVKVKLASLPLPRTSTRWPDPAKWEVAALHDLAVGDWVLLRDPKAPGDVLAVERLDAGPADAVVLHARNPGNEPVAVTLHRAATVGRWPASERAPWRPR